MDNDNVYTVSDKTKDARIAMVLAHHGLCEAAPELLACVQETVDLLNSMHLPLVSIDRATDLLTACYAAIAKAEGQ